MEILITGGNGFIGRVARHDLRGRNHGITLALRDAGHEEAVNGREHISLVGQIDGRTDWSDALAGIDVVVHLAARAHQVKDVAADPRTAFLEVNYNVTKRLAEQAAGRVQRFIFLSTIGVHGSTSEDRALDEKAPIAPETPYAESKAKAEECVLDIAANGGFEAIVLRPPLVYGANAPGNFARLIAAVRRGIPLPLGLVRNQRSLIGVDHLAKAILAAVEAESVDSQPYLVADRQVVSTPEIIRSLATGLGKSGRLLPIPVSMLRLSGAVSGRRTMVEQLVGNLTVNAGAFRRVFGDVQPCSTVDGLVEAARATSS